MSISAIPGYGSIYALRMPAEPPSSRPAEPVLVDKWTRSSSVGGQLASNEASKATPKEQGFYGVGATSGENGRSAWEPTGNLEILDMKDVFLELRSVPGEQGPGFIGKYIEELNELAINRQASA